MLKKDIKISVIIRTYNSAKFISESIDSALNQTINKKFYEIIIVDDGSRDSTLNILKKYKKRIRLIKQNHSGPVIATNRGIIESRGEYITLLDSDDTFEPDILEKIAKVFNNNISTDFAYCDYFERIGNKKEIISLKKNIFLSLGCAIVFKKKLFKEIGMFNENLIFAEYDFLIRLIRNKKRGKYIPIPLYVYRRNKASLTFNKQFVDKGIKQLERKYGDIVKKIRKY